MMGNFYSTKELLDTIASTNDKRLAATILKKGDKFMYFKLVISNEGSYICSNRTGRNALWIHLIFSQKSSAQVAQAIHVAM
jgi:hypothetical protein